MSIQRDRALLRELAERVGILEGKVSKEDAATQATHNVERAAAVIDPQRTVSQTDVPNPQDIPTSPAQTEGAGTQGAGATDQEQAQTNPRSQREDAGQSKPAAQSKDATAKK